jgi:hypothetical protein
MNFQAARLQATDLCMTDAAMVRIPGGRILVGSDAHYAEERPA